MSALLLVELTTFISWLEIFHSGWTNDSIIHLYFHNAHRANPRGLVETVLKMALSKFCEYARISAIRVDPLG